LQFRSLDELASLAPFFDGAEYHDQLSLSRHVIEL